MRSIKPHRSLQPKSELRKTKKQTNVSSFLNHSSWGSLLSDDRFAKKKPRSQVYFSLFFKNDNSRIDTFICCFDPCGHCDHYGLCREEVQTALKKSDLFSRSNLWNTMRVERRCFHIGSWLRGTNTWVYVRSTWRGSQRFVFIFRTRASETSYARKWDQPTIIDSFSVKMNWGKQRSKAMWAFFLPQTLKLRESSFSRFLSNPITLKQFVRSVSVFLTESAITISLRSEVITFLKAALPIELNFVRFVRSILVTALSLLMIVWE